MQPKSVMIFGAATAVMVIAAAYAVLDQRSPSAIAPDRDPAFPGLIDKVNDVAEIKIQSATDTFTIKRVPNGWGLAEKGGYPVSFEKVKGAIVGLANLKLLEAKTNNPDRYERLEVRDPKVKEAKSKRVALSDGSGTKLAEGIIGRRNASLFGDAGGGTYIRRGNDELSWLAEGTVDIGATPNDWMIRDLVNIDAEAVKRVVIRQPDGAELVIHKSDKKQEKFVVDNIPSGRKLKSDNEGKEVAGGLWRLTLEDVKPASEKKLPAELHKAVFTTFDGLQVEVEVAIMGDDYWGRFSASAKNAVGDEKAKKEIEKKAKEITDRTKGWHYRLSVGEGERLTTKIKDLLEDEKPA